MGEMLQPRSKGCSNIITSVCKMLTGTLSVVGTFERQIVLGRIIQDPQPTAPYGYRVNELRGTYPEVENNLVSARRLPARGAPDQITS